MSIQFVWDKKYSVGNDEIDQQHMDMFELANQLPEASDSGEIRPIIMKLYQHVRKHFSEEEKMMADISFPMLDEHKSLHDNLITRLNELSSNPLDTDEALHEFKKFIYNWLIEHIMTEDFKYFQFSVKKGPGSSNS